MPSLQLDTIPPLRLCSLDFAQDIGALETYIGASQLIQLFCSAGYFKSRNCLREVRATLEQGKDVTLMADPEKGGAPLEVIKNEECPEELRGPVFDERGIVNWYRIADFQKARAPAPLLRRPPLRSARPPALVLARCVR